MLSTQEIFDKVARHLLTQGRPSFGVLPTEPHRPPFCMYRDNEGGMCAVGCLLPDELYDPTMEKGTLSSSTISDVLADNEIIPPLTRDIDDGLVCEDQSDQYRLLYRLQDAHDADARVMSHEEWREIIPVRLRRIALNFGLNSDVLGEFDEPT